MTGPRLSVVIAAWNSADYLRACLASLAPQFDGATMETIVAANLPPGDCSAVAAEFPFVRLLPPRTSATVPELRMAGLQEARGDIMALTEDHMTFARQWCSEILKAHELPHAAIGGTVENSDQQSLLDWAVYFYDYGAYMPPCTAGAVPALSGANVSYKSSALAGLGAMTDEGFYEAFVHAELTGSGQTLYLHPPATVTHHKRYTAAAAFRHAYHLARDFSAGRARKWPAWRRFWFGAGAVVLPLVLASRILLTVLRKGRRAGKLLASFPILLPLLTVWAAGEWTGYWFGAGESREFWK